MGDQASLPNEEALRAEIIRLNKVVKALMNRAERAMSAGKTISGYSRQLSCWKARSGIGRGARGRPSEE